MPAAPCLSKETIRNQAERLRAFADLMRGDGPDGEMARLLREAARDILTLVNLPNARQAVA
jgi:hypothetical protein